MGLRELEGVDLAELSFQNGTGGRAEEYGWTVAVNNSGLVIGLAQGTGNPIPAGEGLLTQIPWIELNSLIKIHNIDWIWVKGHSGHLEKERADELANNTIEALTL
mgnify:CR=1 FL=1